MQRKAIRMAVENPVMLLTGGPGTGKTTVLKGVLDYFAAQGKNFILVAPTGRAAKRMSTLTVMRHRQSTGSWATVRGRDIIRRL